MIPLSGYIYCDGNFNFHDGTVGKKLFVVCCDSPREDNAVIVARTTSQPKSKLEYGCYTNQHPPCFYLPESQSGLNGQTWVLFDYLTTYDDRILKRWDHIGSLEIAETAAMLLCGATSEYISGWEKKALQEHGRLLIPKPQ